MILLILLDQFSIYFLFLNYIDKSFKKSCWILNLILSFFSLNLLMNVEGKFIYQRHWKLGNAILVLNTNILKFDIFEHLSTVFVHYWLTFRYHRRSILRNSRKTPSNSDFICHQIQSNKLIFFSASKSKVLMK